MKAEYDQAEGIIQSLNARVAMMGGTMVNRDQAIDARGRREVAAARLRRAMEQVRETGCVVKDLDIGLVDFPAMRRGVEVCLCWKLGETVDRVLARRGRRVPRAQAHRPGFPRSASRQPGAVGLHGVGPARDRNQTARPDAATARRLLRRAGFRVSRRRVFEANTVFDTPDLSLRASQQLLRVREAGGVVTLTYKGPPAVARHKSREELELEVSAAAPMAAILDRLGFRPVFRYEKYRTEYRQARKRRRGYGGRNPGGRVPGVGRAAAVDRPHSAPAGLRRAGLHHRQLRAALPGLVPAERGCAGRHAASALTARNCSFATGRSLTLAVLSGTASVSERPGNGTKSHGRRPRRRAWGLT